jgi:ribonuclease Z
MRLTLAGHHVEAISVGGIETCFQLPEFDVCLDIGRCPPGAELRSRVLLTHAHIDHAAGLPYYVSMRALTNMKPPQIWCPKPSHAGLSQLLQVWTTLQADADRCTLTPVEPGDEIDLGKGAYAKTFRSPHRIACIGYTLFRRKKKLREDLEQVPREEIAERARGGEEVSRTVEVAEVCYPGDTMADVIDNEPTVTQARVLILECTFFSPKVDVPKARRSGHVHFEELADRAHLFQNECILLTHFSRRHSRSEIEGAVKALPKELRKRIRLLLHEAPEL